MPIHNQFFHDGRGNLTPQGLTQAGPVLQVEVSIPTALAQLLSNTSQNIPQPAVGLALVDTGASRSCVDQQAITTLGVNPVGSVSVGTPAGPAQQFLYPARFHFPAQQMEFEFTQVVGANLTGQLIGGQPLLALIGRDVLARCVFIYNGTMGAWTLTL